MGAPSRWWRAAAATVLVAAIAGCSGPHRTTLDPGPSAGSARATPDRAQGPGPTLAATGVVDRTTNGRVTVAWADGTAVPVHDLDADDIGTHLPAGDAAKGGVTRPVFGQCAGLPNLVTLRDDGSWFSAMCPGATCVQDAPVPNTRPGRVGVLAGDRFAPWESTATTVDDPVARTVVSAVVDGATTAWVEDFATDDVSDWWRIFTAGPDGRPRLVARAEELPGSEQGWLPHVAVLDGRVYWEALRPVDATFVADHPDVGVYTDSGQAYAIVSRALDGTGPIRTEAWGATDPVVVDGHIAVLTWSMRDVNTSGVPDQPLYETRLRATGVALLGEREPTPVFTLTAGPEPVNMLQYPLALHGAGTSLAFSAGPVTYVADLSTRDAHGYLHLAAIKEPSAQRGAQLVNDVGVSDDLLAWSYGGTNDPNTNPVFILDRATGQLARIDLPTNHGRAHVAGHYVAWETETTDGLVQTTTVRWPPK